MLIIKIYSISSIGILFLLVINNSLFGQSDYIPRYNTIAHKMLQIEDSLKLDFPDYKIFPDYKTLDDLIDNSKTYITKKEDYSKEDIEKITEKIYADIKNRIPGIKERADICYRKSLIFLGIADENNIPFYFVDIPGEPGHIFIRYDPDGKHDPLNPDNPINKDDINIETTGEGTFSDRFYINKYHLSKKSLEKNLIFKNLNEKELLAKAYCVRALETGFRNKTDEAILKNCNKALELDSNSIYAHRIKTVYWNLNENPNKAIENYTKAIQINIDPFLCIGRGKCYSRLGKSEKAIADYTKAMELLKDWQKQVNDRKKYLDLEALRIRCLSKRGYEYEEIDEQEKAYKDREAVRESIRNLYK